MKINCIGFKLFIANKKIDYSLHYVASTDAEFIIPLKYFKDFDILYIKYCINGYIPTSSKTLGLLVDNDYDTEILKSIKNAKEVKK